ncbi:hypothetical protein H312_01087 [Anncaliia algerae PRA339]|uniref:Uncharacterized protein n=1 Tax=Anncaliia algerae PRA339 TaxID=1288291 RepID=A0A059F2M0_9MICR|nr:hypothetical protein H312_01086 [Anncaliia algerae PRA339]KCZ81509.1 hypothetical protein H312_01087 [Anncaliia algerae PRA339]
MIILKQYVQELKEKLNKIITSKQYICKKCHFKCVWKCKKSIC